MPPGSALGWLLRILGAVALFGVAGDHLYEYFVDQYSTVPTIGTLFFLNGAGAITLGVALLMPVQRFVSPRYAGRLLAVIAGGGIGLAATTLAGLLVSESTPLFGFREYGYRPVIVVSIAAEAATIILLTAFLGQLVRVLNRPAGAAGTRSA